MPQVPEVTWWMTGSPEEYVVWTSWEMASGTFPHSVHGLTADTVHTSVAEALAVYTVFCVKVDVSGSVFCVLLLPGGTGSWFLWEMTYGVFPCLAWLASGYMRVGSRRFFWMDRSVREGGLLWILREVTS